MSIPNAESDTLPIRPSRIAPLLLPINAFFSTKSSGGILLLVSALVALAWANSPWRDTYQNFWHTYLTLEAGAFSYSMSLEHFVNDGLMAIFFLLVGLEIKREVLIGELASLRRASLPIAAAIGGMVVPALIFAGFNIGGPAATGWGVPMATDIAFAVGVLTLVGRGIPISVKVFLLAVAIVDDLGAVLVIAIFYTHQISLDALVVAGLFLTALVFLNVARIHSPLPYLLLGIGLWMATLSSGVHATVAGVLLAFTIPATRQIEEEDYLVYVQRMLELFRRDAQAVPDQITESQSHALKAMEEASQAVQTPLARVEHALLAPVTFFIVPLFALANAGVDIHSVGMSAFSSPIAWGVLLGLLLGKPVGILLASWIAIEVGIASLPENGTWRHLSGVALLCGIGFTMSLFVANLAFSNNEQFLAVTKLSVLVASVVSGVLGSLLVLRAPPECQSPSDTIANYGLSR